MGDSIRSLLHRSSSCHQPWQLSAAIALGVVCGLLPKFSLLFCLIAVVCCAIPIHLPLAAATTLLLSFVAAPFTQAAGYAGLWSLTNSGLVDMWSSLDRIPWLPWIGLNNSVVHGSFLIGLGVAVPIFFLSRPLAVRLSPARSAESAVAADPDFRQELKPAVAARQAVKTSLAPPRDTAPSGISVAMHLEQPSESKQPVVVQWDDVSQRGSASQSIRVSVVDEHTCVELEKLLATCNAEQSYNVGPAQVAQRAAQMVQYVDELLTSYDLHPTPSLAHATILPPDAAARPAEAQRATQAATPSSAAAMKPPEARVASSTSALNSTRQIHQPQERNPAQAHIQSAGPTRNPAASRELKRAGDVALRTDSGVPESSPRRPAGDLHQAETLRYLLEHLRAIQDKV